VTRSRTCSSICWTTGLASSRPLEFVLLSQTWQVRTTKDACPKFAYLVLRNGQI